LILIRILASWKGKSILEICSNSIYTSNPSHNTYLRDEVFHTYTGELLVSNLLLFINKVLYPAVELKSEEDIDKFIDPRVEWIEKTDFIKGSDFPVLGHEYAKLNLKTRVLAIFCNVEDFKGELKQYKEAAFVLARRNDLRMAYVTDKALCKMYKEAFGRAWFNEFSSESMLIFRGK
jgi:hypothetical protein